MKKLFKIFALCSLFLLCACAAEEKKPETVAYKADVAVKDPVFDGKIEPIKGKTDVYASIARAVKYNADAAARNMKDKVFGADKYTPGEVIENIKNSKKGDESPLYDGLRALDFAVIYASANLTDNDDYLDGYLYERSAQNLAKAAIKAHKDAQFAIKTNKEISRLVDKETKKLNTINNTLEKRGSLKPEELEYKRGLEVGILRLSELKKDFSIWIVNYAHLVKAADPAALELEGRKFYELELLDNKVTTEVFQHSAYKNRDELYVAQEMLGKYTFAEIKTKLSRRHPEAESLKINEFTEENQKLIDALENRAYRIADLLIGYVAKYNNYKQEIRSEKKIENRDEYLELKQAVFDELTVAVFAQIDLARSLVLQTEFDLSLTEKEISSVRREINRLKKEYRLSDAEKVELLNYEIKLIELEAKQSQILAERAFAIRSLYFYAGFSPFKKHLMRADLAEIAKALKEGFNNDVVEMLAKVPPVKPEEAEQPLNEWAKGENWLEDLVEGKAEEPLMGSEKNTQTVEAYAGDVFNVRKTMQLGSYLERKNADDDWERLQKEYPELKGLSPQFERVKVDGKDFYRMSVFSGKGGFREVCNKMRANNEACILR